MTKYIKSVYRILLTGGGTGGHVFPLVAVARELQRMADDPSTPLIRYYGPKAIYNDYLKKEGIAVKNIAGAKWRRYFSLLNFLDIFKFSWSILQSFWKIYWYMPDVAFSKGGPGALPVLFACWFYKIPIFIHESDTFPGLTNQISSRWAKKVFVAWESAKQHFPDKNTNIVGIPLRDVIIEGAKAAFANPNSASAAKEKFSFNISEPLVLILGGSQGAQKINEFTLNNLEGYLPKFQILHQVGSANYEEYSRLYRVLSEKWSKELKERCQFYAFFETNLAEAYAAADLIISRAGATAIFEIAAFGKPSILMPITESAGDHQRINAYEYARTGAAIVIEEANLLSNVVLGQIEKILNSQELKNGMSTAAKSFAKPDAAKLIAVNILIEAVTGEAGERVH